MESMIKSNNFVRTLLVKVAPATRQFDRPLIGLGTAVGKEDAVEHTEFC